MAREERDDECGEGIGIVCNEDAFVVTVDLRPRVRHCMTDASIVPIGGKQNRKGGMWGITNGFVKNDVNTDEDVPSNPVNTEHVEYDEPQRCTAVRQFLTKQAFLET